MAYWREFYWASLADKNLNNWLRYISEFSFIALTLCYTTGKSQWFINYAALIRRRELTDVALTKDHQSIEGGAQRVQEDPLLYPQLRFALITNLSKNLVMMFIMLGIIIHQIGTLFVLLPIGYALIGTFIAHKIANPLFQLNYNNQQAEAAFRHKLTIKHYEDTHIINILLYGATKRLQYFQSFYNQLTVIIPHVMLAPMYFLNNLTFGVFMQCASSITHVIEYMSYLINSYDSITKYKSCEKRLKELEVIK